MWNILKHGASGTYHQIKHLPYQDTWDAKVSGDFAAGFLLDGCTGSPYSHIGAQLAVEYITREALNFVLIYKYQGQELASVLFDSLKLYLSRLAWFQRIRSDVDRDKFINDYLMFTVSGFIITPTTTYGLMCGDGILLINGYTAHEDQDNKPTYPGYCLLSTAPEDKVPTGFNLWEIETETIDLIGVVSDAFVERPEYLDKVRQIKRQNKLELEINKWTEVEQLFADDTSVVMARREEK